MRYATFVVFWDHNYPNSDFKLDSRQGGNILPMHSEPLYAGDTDGNGFLLGGASREWPYDIASGKLGLFIKECEEKYGREDEDESE